MQTTLRRAVTDPKLLGSDPLWPGQERVVDAIDTEGARTIVLPWGRRSGKTSIASTVAVWTCLLRDDLSEHMKPGERRWAVIVATNIPQARIALDAARAAVERSPLLRPLIEASTSDELRFKNATGIRAMPCSSRSGRGYPISCLLLDEFGHFQDDTEGFAAADRIWQAMTPSLTQFRGEGITFVASTPWGSDNAFASLYERALDGKLGDHAFALRMSTAEANPSITPEYLASKEAELGEDGFAQEFEAQFLRSGNAFIEMDRVRVDREGDLGPDEHGCTDLIAGLDPSFSGSGDAFGLAIVGTATRTIGLHRLIYADAQRLPRGQTGFEAHMGRIVGTLKMYDVTRAVTDQYADAAVVERLQQDGITCRVNRMGPESKTRAYNSLRGLLYAGTLELYRHRQLLVELGRLRTRFSPGSASVYNPRQGGSHGDVAQALAIVADHIATHTNAPAESINLRDLARQNANPSIRGSGMTLTGRHYLDRDPGGSGDLQPPPGWERIETRLLRRGRHGR